MGWWLSQLTVQILAFLRPTVIFFLLRLTKNLKINLPCFKKLKINFYCGDTHLRSLDHSGKKKKEKNPGNYFKILQFWFSLGTSPEHVAVLPALATRQDIQTRDLDTFKMTNRAYKRF